MPGCPSDGTRKLSINHKTHCERALWFPLLMLPAHLCLVNAYFVDFRRQSCWPVQHGGSGHLHWVRHPSRSVEDAHWPRDEEQLCPGAQALSAQCCSGAGCPRSSQD